MTGYLLDTNIISNITKPEPSESLLAWMAEQDDETLFISSLTIGEIWSGVLQTPAGCMRDELEAWFAGPDGPPALFAGRVPVRLEGRCCLGKTHGRGSSERPSP